MGQVAFFGRNFDIEIAREQEEAEAEGPRVHSEAELDAAMRKARAEGEESGFTAGHEAGMAAARAEIAESTRQSLAALQPLLESFTDAMDTHRTALERQLADYALALCERLFPEFIARHGAERAAAEISALAGQLHDRPCLSLHAAPDVVADIESRVSALSGAARPKCDLRVTANPDLAPGEAHLGWSNGFVEVNYDRMLRTILAELRRTQASLKPAGTMTAPVTASPSNVEQG